MQHLLHLVDNFCHILCVLFIWPRGDTQRVYFRSGAWLKVSVEGNILLAGDFGARLQTEIVTGCRGAPSVLDREHLAVNVSG